MGVWRPVPCNLDGSIGRVRGGRLPDARAQHPGGNLALLAALDAPGCTPGILVDAGGSWQILEDPGGCW